MLIYWICGNTWPLIGYANPGLTWYSIWVDSFSAKIFVPQFWLKHSFTINLKLWPYLRKRPLTETTVEPFFRFNAFSNIDNAFWKHCQNVLERWQHISTKRNIHWKPFQNRWRTFGMRLKHWQRISTNHNGLTPAHAKNTKLFLAGNQINIISA